MNHFQDDLLKTTTEKEVEELVNAHMSVVYEKDLPDRGPFKLEICKILISLRQSESYEDVAALADSLAKYKITTKEKRTRDSYVNVLTNTKGENLLLVRLPAVGEAPTDIKDTAAFYIHFMTCMLGISSTNVRITFDESLGKVIKLPKTVKDCVDNLIKSAQSSSGLVGMKTYKFDNGFKGPMPALLCAMRILKKNLATYRKVSKKAVHLEKLRDMVNSEFGFKNPGFNEYVRDLITQTLALMTSENQTFFPASFYACAKSENDKKTTQGLLASLGYVCIIPNPDKVKYIATRKIVLGDNGAPSKIENVDKDKFLERDKEFEMGVKMILPLLDGTRNTKLKSQLKDPIGSLSMQTQTYYKSISSLVDEVNKAYAFLVSYEKKQKKSKTKITHVVSKIGECSRLVQNKAQFKDARGTLWNEYMDIPYEYRKFLENLLQRRRSSKRRRTPEERAASESSKKRSRNSTTSGPSVNLATPKHTKFDSPTDETDMVE